MVKIGNSNSPSCEIGNVDVNMENYSVSVLKEYFPNTYHYVMYDIPIDVAIILCLLMCLQRDTKQMNRQT